MNVKVLQVVTGDNYLWKLSAINHRLIFNVSEKACGWAAFNAQRLNLDVGFKVRPSYWPFSGEGCI
jgi:hypothetical protein